MSYKKILKSLTDLKKGSRQSKMKFNPKNVHEDEREIIDTWVSDVAGREDIPKIDPNAKKRGMHKLHSKTSVRKNPKTGEREFLLHRGMGHHEVMGAYDKMRTSWTPNYKVARMFAEDHNAGYESEVRAGIKGSETKKAKIVSAWIPERHIHHILPAIGEEGIGEGYEPSHALSSEHEVIVNPHNFNQANPNYVESLNNNKKNINQRINERHKIAQSFHNAKKANDRLKITLGNKATEGWDKKIEDGKREKLAQFNKQKLAASEKDVLIKAEQLGKPAVKLNPEHGKTIADAYEQMPHNPQHPDVQNAYNALIGETKDQFNKMMAGGLKISRITPDMKNPYKNSKELHSDIKNNNHLWYFPTEQGFGSDGSDKSDHPMMQKTGLKHGEHELLANDIFRIVHDINGHHLGGESGFGPKGEHEAYLTHKKMFSPLAQKALTTETLGQNSWVNFGPHGEHNRTNPEQTRYAEQKAGLLPDHIVQGNWHTADEKPMKKAENKKSKKIKDIAHDQQMHMESGRPMPLDHISDNHDPAAGVEDKKVTNALADLKSDKQSTKTMFQRVYSIPSEQKMKGSKRAKMTGQVPSSINIFGSHYPVVKLVNDNTLLLHTSEYGNEGKTTELVNKIKKDLPNHFPDFKVIEVHHPDYRHSAKIMRMRNQQGLKKFLESASKEHPDENYRQHAVDALNHLYPVKKGEWTKPIHAKRTEAEGWDVDKNTQIRLKRIGKYLESVGLSPDLGEGKKRDLGSESPTSVTINTKGDPHDQQLLHEGGHAMLTPEGATLGEYQLGIGEPGYKGKLHQTQFRDELKDSHAGGMPEQAAQQMEAGIARRSGVEPFRSPQRGASARSEIERSRKHAQNQLKLFDEGILRFDPFSGENEVQGTVNAHINAKQMGDKELTGRVREKLKTNLKAKKQAKESGDWDDELLAASEKEVVKKL